MAVKRTAELLGTITTSSRGSVQAEPPNQFDRRMSDHLSLRDPLRLLLCNYYSRYSVRYELLARHSLYAFREWLLASRSPPPSGTSRISRDYFLRGLKLLAQARADRERERKRERAREREKEEGERNFSIGPREGELEVILFNR